MAGRNCAFCGQGAKSREHLWPDWVNGYCKPPTPLTHVAYDPRSGVVHRTFHSAEFDQRARWLCHDCNVNWLSRLEGEVSGLIGPMMTGQARRLEIGDQKLIAAWVAKTVMMLQYLSSHRPLPVPARHVTEFYQRGFDWSPPANTQVWVAHYMGDALGAHFDMQPLQVESEVLGIAKSQNAYAATIQVCEFAAQIYGCGVDVQIRFRFPPLFERRVIQIWPAVEPIDWPPDGVSDAGMQKLIGVFGDPQPLSKLDGP